jgi:hypothetical protein
MVDHRSDLLAAVAALPTADDDSWAVPTSILDAAMGASADVAQARRHVLAFSSWARGAVQQLPEIPRDAMQATDFSDYYKVVMSRVQLLYAQATSSADADLRYPTCRFQSQLRRRPQFLKDGVTRELGVFDTGAGSEWVGSLEESLPAFRAALRAVGERRFDAPTLRALLASHAAPFAGMEASMQPLNEAWVARLAGTRLFELLDEGADFAAASEAVQAKVVVHGGQVVVLVQGPWFRVTFAETPVLQCMAQFMTDALVTVGDQDGAGWCRHALLNFAIAAHAVQCAGRAPPPNTEAAVGQMAWRRAPPHALSPGPLRRLSCAGSASTRRG